MWIPCAASPPNGRAAHHRPLLVCGRRPQAVLCSALLRPLRPAKNFFCCTGPRVLRFRKAAEEAARGRCRSRRSWNPTQCAELRPQAAILFCGQATPPD
ncbi:hypothetical protein NDU88_010137 [Pleurodeles waltl]|uniref:Uncharacterized protein n=1 Tax=Pleurodeles waltl TaxID=8319 RepID=A0AAV7QV22_PLEWA|nr:hypothetical protein NDU88_010137 [Pleurodeles waltl]